MVKWIITLAFTVLSGIAAFARDYDYFFTEASELAIVGKVFPGTPNPYQRMDFTKYGGWDEKDINLLEMPSGIVVSFKTNSPVIAVKPDFSYLHYTNASCIASRGGLLRPNSLIQKRL